MHGFKSFAKKEILELSEGVTTVVGPNGCGKTNIVDAIRWVLGEQRSSVLRGGKMEDVIFNGAEGIKPLSVCDVALTVHNNKGKLPIEYNDIEIGRRVYRNGESEYTLNKTPCRLKDINDLFIDTGMGSDAYSVIELKMIEQILSENGNDRRRMFEEASGINKYRKQRKSTLRKFDATKFDLERINDVISEVEQKVHGLELQLKRFKRHEKLTHDLSNKDIALAYVKVHRYKSMILPLKKDIKEYSHLKDSSSSKSSTNQKELERFRLVYQKQEEEINVLQSELSEVIEEQQDIRQNILVWSEKGRSCSISIDRVKNEYSKNKENNIILKQDVKDYNSQIKNLETSINKKIDIFKNEKLKLRNIEKIYQESIDALDHIQNNRWAHQKAMANDRSLHDRTVNLIDVNNNNNVLIKKKLYDYLKELNKNKKSISNIEKKQHVSKTDLNKYKKILTKLELELEDKIEQNNKLMKKQNSVLIKKGSLIDQVTFYKDLIESNEGFPEGAQFVLENPKEFSDVLGTVADLFQVQDQYRDALEVSLGDLSHCIVSKDKKSAMKIFDLAIEKGAGDFTLIPLKEVSAIKVKLKNMPRNKSIIGRASELINTDKNVKPLADYILGEVLIVEDMKKVVADETLTGWTLVDLNGKYSGNNLILKNKQISEHGNLVGRKQKLDTLNNEFAKTELEEKKIKDSLFLMQNNIQDLNNQLDNNHSLVLSLSENITQLESDLMRNHLGQSQLLENISILEKELKHNKNLVSDSKKALKKLEPLLSKGEKTLLEFQEEIDKANKNVSKASLSRDNQQQILQDLRIEMINCESQRDNLLFKSSSANKQIRDIDIRQSEILNEEKDLIKAKSDYGEKITNGEGVLEKINANIQKNRSIIDLKQSVFRETYSSIEEIQTKINLEQKDRELILEKLKTSEFKLNEFQQKINILNEQIKERYDSKIPKEFIIDQTEEELSYAVEKIKRSLENIGPVNMAVQDEYNEDFERLGLLQKQREDLIDSEQNLRQAIQKIDRIARKKFQDTFRLINKNYAKLFQLFFEGGYGNLRLIGDPDPLEADITIDAQPPGKKNTSLRLLSSGEKALTAISLLFAIYQVKPSPYCILDEVDAPLDDVNIHKFTKVLKQFADDTQFIIVTHNKLTMEIANFMYGVTQEKKGVSKLVSVAFD